MSGNSAHNSKAKAAIELWKMAKPMDKAIALFGAVRGVSKFKRAADENARASADIGKANFQKAGINADAAFDALMPMHATLSANARIHVAKGNRVLDRLRSGELVAFGFPVHDPKATLPEAVPPFLFDQAFAKWSKRSFVGHGRRFIDVTIGEAMLGTALELSPAKPVGAPSFDAALEIIADILTKQGVPFDDPPWKRVGHLFREAGHELRLSKFDEKHPSNETVRRFVEARKLSKT